MHLAVQITGSKINVNSREEQSELARYTNMFVQKFAFRELVAPDPAQVNLIKRNYPRMAHRSIKDTNKMVVAARRDILNELFPQPGFATPMPIKAEGASPQPPKPTVTRPQLPKQPPTPTTPTKQLKPLMDM